MSFHRLRSALMLFCALLGFAGRAAAETKTGIDLGIGRLRLGVDLSAGFDSGVSRVQSIPGDMVERVQGRFDLNLKAPVLELQAGGSVGWNQFAGLFSAATVPLSFLAARFDGKATVGAGRPFGLEVTESFSRGDWVSLPLFRYAVLDASNKTTARLRIAPSGTPLELGVSGYVRTGFFESQLPGAGAVCGSDPACDPGKANLFNHLTYGGQLDTQWRISPTTGLALEGGVGDRRYFHSLIGNQGGYVLNGAIGLGTFITSRFRLQLKAGYAGMLFHQGAAPVHMLTWLADFRYQLTGVLAARIGTGRGLEPTAGTNLYYSDNRAYFVLEFVPARVLFLSLALNAAAIGLSSTVDVQTISGGAVLTAEWATTDWLHLLASVTVNGRRPFGPVTPVNEGMGFLRTVASAGLLASF